MTISKKILAELNELYRGYLDAALTWPDDRIVWINKAGAVRRSIEILGYHLDEKRSEFVKNN